MLNYFFN